MDGLRRLMTAITQSLLFYVVAGFAVAGCLLFIALRLYTAEFRAQQQTTASQRREEYTTMRIGSPARLTRFTSLDGEPIDLLPPDAGSVVLCVFSLACPTCVEDIGLWRTLLEKGARRGIRTLVVSTASDREAIARFAQAYEVDDLPIVYDPRAGQVSEAFEVRYVPQYLHFGRDGKLRYGTVGRSKAMGDRETRAEMILGGGG